MFGEVIHSYTRAQALEDGVLVDVSETAREAGIKFPVALTRAVWESYVAVPEGVVRQDEPGRLWDACHTLRCEILRSGGGEVLYYRLYVRNTNCRPKLVTLKAVCGPGDQAEPVITVMLPEES